MDSHSPNILLADDDIDDCLFFKEALAEFPNDAVLTTVKDGVELMKYLTEHKNHLPDMIFLDLNMPRKTGYACLSEIKNDDKFKDIPVTIYSTSFDSASVDKLYNRGANYYIRKPGEFSILKKAIQNVLAIIAQHKTRQPSKDKFVLQY